MKKLVLVISLLLMSVSSVSVSADPIKRTFEVTEEKLYTPKPLRKGDNIVVRWNWINPDGTLGEMNGHVQLTPSGSHPGGALIGSNGFRWSDWNDYVSQSHFKHEKGITYCVTYVMIAGYLDTWYGTMDDKICVKTPESSIPMIPIEPIIPEEPKEEIPMIPLEPVVPEVPKEEIPMIPLEPVIPEELPEDEIPLIPLEPIVPEELPEEPKDEVPMIPLEPITPEELPKDEVPMIPLEPIVPEDDESGEVEVPSDIEDDLELDSEDEELSSDDESVDSDNSEVSDEPGATPESDINSVQDTLPATGVASEVIDAVGVILVGAGILFLALRKYNKK